MDAILKEFEKVEKAAPGLIQSSLAGYPSGSGSGSSSSKPSQSQSKSKSKSKSQSQSQSSSKVSIPDAIENLIQTLEHAKQSLQANDASNPNHFPNPSILLSELSSTLTQTQKSISERQKEFNSSLSRLSKALEKKFPIQVAGISDPNLFNGKQPQRALEAVILEHLVRENKWETAQRFANEANLPFSPPSLSVFSILHETTSSISQGNLIPAIQWAKREREFLKSKGSGLEFALHKSMFIRIALGIESRNGNEMEIELNGDKGKGKERPPFGSAIGPLNVEDETESKVQKEGGNARASTLDPDGERFFEKDANLLPSSSPPSLGHQGSTRTSPMTHQCASLTSIQSNVEKALAYGRENFKPFLSTNLNEIEKLFTFLLFLPTATEYASNVNLKGSSSSSSDFHHASGSHSRLEDSISSFQTAKNHFDLDAELDLDIEVNLDLNDPSNNFGNPDIYSTEDEGYEPMELDAESKTQAQSTAGGQEDQEEMKLPKPSPLHLSLLSVLPAPYRPFLHPNLSHAPFLLPLFKIEYCSRIRVAKESPLKIGVEVGAGGALNRIWKVRNLMVKKGNEWSQGDELPVEIPIPPHLKFHSTFSCPVSKEQATEENPPMMMTCGHVICLESLNKLGKREGRLKCPYCPTESTVSQAIRVYF